MVGFGLWPDMGNETKLKSTVLNLDGYDRDW